MTFVQQTNTYKFNPEDETWSYPDPEPLPSAQSSEYPALYTTLLVDSEGKDRREREGREQRWDGVEMVYHTTPYPPPTVAKQGSLGEIPYPTVEIWKPPTAKWYQKQFVGKFIGKMHIVAGGLVFKDYFVHALAGTLKRVKPPKPGAVIIGVLCIGFGIYLHAKKYLRDPKAIVRYRQKIFAPTTPFQSVVDEFGWNHLFVIATKEELCYKLYQEMQNVRGLYQICSMYKVNNLKAYLKHDVMRAIDVEARWQYDVLRAADGTGPELGVVVQECGEFLLTASSMQVDKIRESLESDPTMVRSSFTDIFTRFEASIRRIYKKEFLSTAFIREKLIRQLSTDPTFKFSLIAKHRWIVTDGICTPQEISHVFRIARENCPCIVSFLDTFWIWPIEAYHTLIIPDDLEFSKLKQIHHEFIAFKASVQHDIDFINKRYAENVEEARRVKKRKSQQISESTRTKIVELQMGNQHGFDMDAINAVYAREKDSLEKFKEEERVAQIKEKQEMEDKTRQADKTLENKRIALHKEWNAFLTQRKSFNHSSPPLSSYNPQSYPFIPQYPIPSAPSAPYL